MPRLLLAGLLVFATLLVGLRAGPAGDPGHGEPGRFDAARALEAMDRVVGTPATPRPVGSAAHARTLERLTAAFGDLGLTAGAQASTVCRPGRCARVQNRFVELSPERDGPLVVLLAHVDSVPAGPGVSDDGHGLGILVEAARLATLRQAPRNPLAVLVTDGEELGMFGARAFLAEHPARDRVAAVVNVEARGTHGASYLFETSAPNGQLSRLARREVPSLRSTSLFAEVYRRLPNNTDLTVFLDAGLVGANLAFIGGLENYHTRFDDRAHLDPRSVQHQGQQATDLWFALGDADLLALASGGNDVYANVLGVVPLRWPVSAAVGVALGILGWIVGVSAARLRRREASLREVAWTAAGLVAFAGLLGLGAAGLDAGLQALGASWWAVRWPFRVALWALTLAAFWGLGPLWSTATAGSRWVAVWALMGGLGVATAAVVPGASYLFVAPAAFAALVASVALGAAPRWPALDVPWAWGLAGGLVGVLLWLELTLLLEDALALSGPLVVVPLTMVFVAVVPGFEGAGVQRSEVGGLTAITGLACVLALAQPAATLARPAHVVYTHAQVGDRAVWLASGARPPVGFEAAGPEAWPVRVGPWSQPAAVRDDPQPSVEVIEAVPEPGGVRYHVTIRSPRGARTLGVWPPEDALHVVVDDVPQASPDAVSWAGGDALDVQLTLPDGTSHLTVFDVVDLSDEGTPATATETGGHRSLRVVRAALEQEEVLDR